MAGRASGSCSALTTITKRSPSGATSPRLLRAHIRGRPEDDADLCSVAGEGWRLWQLRVGTRARVVLKRFRKPIVEHFDGAVFYALDVRGLQIAVNDAGFVTSFEGFGDLLGDADRFLDRDRALLNPLREGRSFNELENERARLDSSGRLVAAIGLDGHVVVETDDAVLVMARGSAQGVKALVDTLKAESRGEIRGSSDQADAED